MDTSLCSRALCHVERIFEIVKSRAEVFPDLGGNETKASLGSPSDFQSGRVGRRGMKSGPKYLMANLLKTGKIFKNSQREKINDLQRKKSDSDSWLFCSKSEVLKE